MTDLKFKYYFKDENNVVQSQIFTIEEIESGNALKSIKPAIIARCIYTGCNDVTGREIYEGDKYELFNSTKSKKLHGYRRYL